MPAAHQTNFQMPGFGLPLNWLPDDAMEVLFPNALNELHMESGLTRLPLTSLREFAMLHLFNQWTDRPDWHLKIFDDAVVSQWKAEALAVEGSNLTEHTVNVCIDELRYKAKVFEETDAVGVYRGEVIKSDTAIPVSLKDELKIAISPLEQVPTRHRDWYPDSKGWILNLVDPSLFPLVYGQSRILTDKLTTLDDFVEKCGEGFVIPVPLDDDDDDEREPCPFSKKFQWLPCDVNVSDEHGNPRITSYINNLHPRKHPNRYRVIEMIIARTIPLWNMSLTPLRGDQDSSVRIPYHFCTYEDLDPEREVDDEPEQDPEENDADFHQRQIEWIAETHQLSQPEPREFRSPVKPKRLVDLRKDYADQGLQIVVKMENVHLTPEKPEYGSEEWRIEGQINEHICATALFYYDCTNIGSSHIAFRQKSNTGDAIIVDHPYNQHHWLPEVFGCEFEDAAVQEVGGISIQEGRLLTWPNILQHRIHMSLDDTIQSGHCKVLALFLVDPNIRVISTANVPCQRKDWWTEAVMQGPPSRLPVELQDLILAQVEGFPLGLDEATALRLEMIDERTSFAESVDVNFEGDLWTCNH